MSEMRHSDHERIREELIERDPADQELAYRDASGSAELAGAGMDRDQRVGTDGPGTDGPGTDRAGADRDERAGTDRPGTDRAGTDGAAGQAAGRDAAGGTEITELFQPDDVDRFRAGWRDVQSRFVDDPREAVEGADRLVADVLQSLNSRFTDRKHELELRWQQGSEAETEDLRQALRSYRSFFDRLLNV